MGHVTVTGLRVCVATCVAVALLLVAGPPPAESAPAQVRTFGAVKGKRFIIAIDGRMRVRGLRYEQTTRRFGLRAGRHTIVVRNMKGTRIGRSSFTVRDNERITLAVVGSPTRPAIVAIREAVPGDGPRRWARLANLVPGRRLDLRLAGQPFTLVRNLPFARTSRTFIVPGRAGTYGEPGRVFLALGGTTTPLVQQTITIAIGSAVTLVAIPDGRAVKLRPLPR